MARRKKIDISLVFMAFKHKNPERGLNWGTISHNCGINRYTVPDLFRLGTTIEDIEYLWFRTKESRTQFRESLTDYEFVTVKVEEVKM